MAAVSTQNMETERNDSQLKKLFLVPGKNFIPRRHSSATSSDGIIFSSNHDCGSKYRDSMNICHSVYG